MIYLIWIQAIKFSEFNPPISLQIKMKLKEKLTSSSTPLAAHLVNPIYSHPSKSSFEVSKFMARRLVEPN